MLDVARGSSWPGSQRGTAGTNLAAPGAPARIAELAADPLLKGLRPMLQDIDDTSWILLPAVQPALAAMARHGLRFDALLKPHHLPVIGELRHRHPDLAVVIDHAAKPDIANGSARGPSSAGTAFLARLARETSWCCKVSGLVTEAHANWRIDDLRPYVDHLLATFGPDRLMWGGAGLAGRPRWRATTSAGAMPRRRYLPAGTHDAVFGGTAARLYGSVRLKTYSAAALRVVRRASHSCMASSMVMNTAPPSISFWIRRSSIIMRWPRPMTWGWKV